MNKKTLITIFVLIAFVVVLSYSLSTFLKQTDRIESMTEYMCVNTKTGEHIEIENKDLECSEEYDYKSEMYPKQVTDLINLRKTSSLIFLECSILLSVFMGFILGYKSRGVKNE